jgi:glycosyltransferase involved in cell wall biosynthesis
MRGTLRAFYVALKVVWESNFSASFGHSHWGWKDVVYILAGSITGANRLWLSTQLVKKLDYANAVRFAEGSVKKSQRSGVLLLQANNSLQDEKTWLSYVNQYLAYLKLTPITLSNREGTRFSRLFSTAPPVATCKEKISVIMPVFNAEKFLEHAVFSILNQTWQNLEVIIVDDCSVDNTSAVACAIANKDNRVKLLKNEVNVGPYVSKNLALKIATGEYITGQDADDWSHPQRLQRDMEALKISGSTKAVLSTMLRLDDTGTFQIYYERTLASHGDGIRRHAYISLLIEAEYLKKYLGGWDSVRFGGDGELIERAELTLGSNLVRLDDVGMLCLDHPAGLTSDPVHGLSRVSGLSKVRQEYKRSFREWHKSLGRYVSKMDFPLYSRPYSAPSVMQVKLEAVQRNIKAHQSQLGEHEA